jgi:hypothetical protein
MSFDPNAHSIVSKTSRGNLESEIKPDTMLVVHHWTRYDDSDIDKPANTQSPDKTDGNKIVRFIEEGVRRLSNRQR